MSVSVIIGGQYGSEGKGKVASQFAREIGASISIKVGGINSGHTVYSNGKKYVFRTLPTTCLDDSIQSVIPSGAYISENIILDEINTANVTDDNIIIDPYAVVVTDEDVKCSMKLKLSERIGSTESGTGIAVRNRVSRTKEVVFAKDVPSLDKYIADTKFYLSEAMRKKRKIIIEGTQGFGLSLLHSNNYPYVTSRDTSAAAFISEAGLSPFDVENIVMTIRSHPIRVGGNSGPLCNELTWGDVTKESGSTTKLSEFTSVTNKLRRVAKFHEDVINEAIRVNRPNKIVLNHCDYVDALSYGKDDYTEKVGAFIDSVESKIKSRIDFVGLDPYKYVSR